MKTYNVTGIHENGERVDYVLCEHCLDAICDFVTKIRKRLTKGCACERCGR